MGKNKISLLLQLSVLLLMPTVVNGQVEEEKSSGIQCGYHFLCKYTPDGPQNKYLNMRLDYSDGVSMFYDVFTYERDSLRQIAFGEDGSLRDQAAYDEIRSLPRNRLNDITILNIKKSEATQIYKHATISIRGTCDMLVPDWELSEESCTIEGFICKKATADYLGRNWTVWYTEEIPIPIGPWMLWGTPGLIVSAQDREGIFSFQIVWADALDVPGRVALMNKCYPDKDFRRGATTRHFALSMKEAEQMNFKLRTDASYVFEVAGARTNNIDELQKKARKYIPLIPSDYWKGK